ncbi:uncharacterized protein ACB058_018448 [Synchiropus picturatus]
MTDKTRAIRRIPSPPRSSPPRYRKRPSGSYQPQFEEKPYKSKYLRDDHSFHKSRSYYAVNEGYTNVWGPSVPKNHYKKNEIVRYESRNHGGPPPKRKKSTKAVLPTSRDKGIEFTDTPVEPKTEAREWISETFRCPIFGNSSPKDSKQIAERDPREPEEIQSTTGQTAARERAIQMKRKQIDEVYYQQCETFVFVVKKLIAKDPSLEAPIQSSLQENIREIGARCLKDMETFIEEYDSTELS